MDAAYAQTPNLGMDLARFDRRRRVRDAVANDSARAVTVAPPRVKEHTRVKLGISPVSVLLFSFFIFGILCVVFSYAQLSALNSANARMTRELKTASREYNVLTANLESRIKLDEIAEIAVHEYGFVKLDRRQIVYVDMSGKEKAEILSAVPLKNKIRDSLSGIFG